MFHITVSALYESVYINYIIYFIELENASHSEFNEEPSRTIYEVSLLRIQCEQPTVVKLRKIQ